MRNTGILIICILISGCGLNKSIVEVHTPEVAPAEQAFVSNTHIDSVYTIFREPSGLPVNETKNILPISSTEKLIAQKNKQAAEKKYQQQKYAFKQKQSLSKINDEPTAEKPKMNIWALLGFIFVITGVIPIIGNLVGYIMCIVALNQIQKNPGMYTGKGFAVAGFIIFSIFLVAAIVVALFYFNLVSFNGS